MSVMPSVVMPCCELPKLLKGQKALVTGASSGIGKAVALSLGAAGADVAVNYVNYGSNEQAGWEVAEQIKSEGSNAIAVGADVSQEDQVQAMFRRAIDEFGTVDIVVNNAGLGNAGGLREPDDAHPLQANRRAGRHRPSDCVAGVRPSRLRQWCKHLH